MKPTLRQIEEREKQKKEKRQIDTLIKYDRAKICPKCGELMRYAFGEVFKCDNCGAEELTSFGKVRKYIEDHGPSNPTTVVPVRIGGDFNPIYEEERAILKMLIDENNCIRMSCGIIVDNRLIVEKGPLNNCQTYITRIDRHKRIAELGIELWKEPRRIKAGLEVRAKLTASEYDAGRIA